MDRLEVIYFVLDILKPHQPYLPAFALFVRELEGIQRVDVNVVEIDDKTVSLKVIVKGIIDYEGLRAHLTKVGAVIKSVDQVVVGSFRTKNHETGK